MGIDVITIAGDANIASQLQKYKPDIAINLVDSVCGKASLGSSIPGVLEVLQIPYTGSGTLGWALGLQQVFNVSNPAICQYPRSHPPVSQQFQ